MKAPAVLLLPRAGAVILRTYGARGLWLRTAHEARRALGAFRASPRHRLERHDAGASRSPFAVEAAALAAATDARVALERAERVAAGRHQAFRWDWAPLPTDGAGWLRQPVSGASGDASVPWWRVRHLDPAFGDIKLLWEPARFGWAYDLVRGYLISGDERFAAAFHRQLGTWSDANRPFFGPHWSCGQETAVRAAALLYAEANLGGAAASTPEALATLGAVLAASGERIADAIGYAVSQRNNHGISEAAGLVLLGARFRDRHPEARIWLRAGRRLLERLIPEQIAEDGWYIQHSFNYLRVALDQCVLAERALRGVGATLSDAAVRRIAAAADLLAALVDPESGEAPNHGASDGAFVHPITLGGYRDYRPVLTAVCSLWRHPLPRQIAVDREVLAWLGTEAPPPGPETPPGALAGRSGWALARVGGVRVFLRAGAYRSRPGHIDPLHVDIRIDGREVVVDPGTFCYNAPPPWDTGLALAAVHNGPVVDGEEPGVRGPRFLWLRWPEARLLEVVGDGREARIVAEVPGSHRREVTVRPERVTVVDRVAGARARRVAVCWLLHPEVAPAALRVEGDSRRVSAAEGSAAGWFSPAYGVRIASICVKVERDLGGGSEMRVEVGRS